MSGSYIAIGVWCILAASASVEAQSTFWLNNAYGPVNAPVFDEFGHPLDGTNYLVELWGGGTPDSLNPAVAAYTGERIIIPFESLGYFLDHGQPQRGYSTVFSVRPITELAWLQVRAWQAALGATYEETFARGIGGYGESPLFQAVGSDPLDMLSLPGRLSGLQSFSLRAVVPEPSTWALLAVGGLGLWWQVRRRS